MKIQTRAGAVVLAGVLAGTVYGATLTLPQQQQDNSAQQKGKQSQDDKKKKNAQSGNAANTPANQTEQPANAPPPNNPPPSGTQPSSDKPTPLFGGAIGLKSSRQTKDSATLGFNGVNPDGTIQKAVLNAAATPSDIMSAQKVAQYTVSPGDLVQFLQDGGLNLSAPAQKP